MASAIAAARPSQQVSGGMPTRPNDVCFLRFAAPPSALPVLPMLQSVQSVFCLCWSQCRRRCTAPSSVRCPGSRKKTEFGKCAGPACSRGYWGMMCFINGVFDFVKFIDFWAGRQGQHRGHYSGSPHSVLSQLRCTRRFPSSLTICPSGILLPIVLRRYLDMCTGNHADSCRVS